MSAVVSGWGQGCLAFTYQVTDDSISSGAANCSILQETLLSVPGHRGTLSHGKSERLLLASSWPARESGTGCLGGAREAGSVLMSHRALPFSRDITARIQHLEGQQPVSFFFSCFSD